MEIAILKATNEFIIVTGKIMIFAGKGRFQVERRYKDAYRLPCPNYFQWFKESDFEIVKNKWK